MKTTSNATIALCLSLMPYFREIFVVKTLQRLRLADMRTPMKLKYVPRSLCSYP
jgi:hypothetical protein